MDSKLVKYLAHHAGVSRGFMGDAIHTVASYRGEDADKLDEKSYDLACYYAHIKYWSDMTGNPRAAGYKPRTKEEIAFRFGMSVHKLYILRRELKELAVLDGCRLVSVSGRGGGWAIVSPKSSAILVAEGRLASIEDGVADAFNYEISLDHRDGTRKPSDDGSV